MDANNYEPKSPDSKRRRVYEVTIMDLPKVILVEILSRLPIKVIFCCKCVCKFWYTLPSDPLFTKMYHRFPSLFVYFPHHFLSSIVQLKADSDYVNRPIMLNPNFHLPHPYLEFIGSCNGLVCFLKGDTWDENHSVYISNPLLGEYFNLKLPKLGVRDRRVSYGLCFSEVYGLYKVLRSIRRSFRRHTHVVYILEVYTLGVDKEWRNVSEGPYRLWDLFGYVNVNDAVQWITRDHSEKCLWIYSFDIGTENVQFLPMPPGLESRGSTLRHLILAELRNCLCLIDNSSIQHVDIWWMKEYGNAESWTKDRILLNRIPPGINCDYLIPTVIWKDGEILMQNRSGAHLVSYNPKEKKFRKIDICSNPIAVIDIEKYIPSFNSLKTIMGDSFQVSNVYPKRQIV